MRLQGVCGQWLTVHVELPGGGLEHRAGPHTWSWTRGWRPISGIVADVAHLGWDDSDDEYELELRPWLFEATLRERCRIYQDLDVRQILEQLLGAYPHPVQWRLEASYPRRDFQVQYHETDLEFFERLVQEWGIRVRSGDAEFELKLQAPADAGDGTVPAERSGAKAPVQGCLWEQKGYEHQESYRVDKVLSATLYAMVRMDQKFPS